jgi:hypothetical protein
MITHRGHSGIAHLRPKENIMPIPTLQDHPAHRFCTLIAVFGAVALMSTAGPKITALVAWLNHVTGVID